MKSKNAKKRLEHRIYKKRLMTLEERRKYDLERALKGDPFQYRDGMSVFEWRHFAKAKTIVTIDEGGRIHKHDEDGKEEREGKWDLVMIPQKKEYWVNLFRLSNGNIRVGNMVYSSESKAKGHIAPKNQNYIKTVKVHEEIV